jgi:hypothetical protein
MPIQPRRGAVPAYTPPGLTLAPRRPDPPPLAAPPPEPMDTHAPTEAPLVEEGPGSPSERSAPKKVRSTSPRPRRGTTGKPGPSAERPFHERFAEWIECGGFTKSGAARKLGLPRERVREWCNGRRMPNGHRLLTIARTLGLSLDLLNSEP